MQAVWCRSKNKPLISARLHLASARLPVSSSLEHQNYIIKNIRERKFYLFSYSEKKKMNKVPRERFKNEKA
jgi:hypothetical protein